MAAKALGLVELAFALFGGVKRDGNEHVPLVFGEFRGSFADKQIRQERFEPKGATVFIAMDNFEDEFASGHRRAGADEIKFHIAAVRALEIIGDLSDIG